MTLDSWLSRASSPDLSQLPPPAKRQRHERAASEPVNLNPACRPKSRALLEPPPKFGREMAKTLLKETWPPEYLFGRRSLQAWYSSRAFYDPSYPYSLACLPDSPHSIIGLETGEIQVVKCGSRELGLHDPAVGRADAVLRGPGYSRSPVYDMAALGNGRIICTSDKGIHSMDLNSDSTASLVGGVLDVTNISIRSSTSTVVAYGTSSGSVGVVDLRQRVPEVAREWADAHAVLGGPRAQRVRHAITAVTFSSDTILATASNANECVKFWDLRASSRKQPFHTTASRSSSRPRSSAEGGIIALAGSVTDPEQALWGLTRSGELLKVDQGSYHPQCRLNVPGMRMQSLFASIDLIPGRAVVDLPKTGHRAPEWPLIACGGERGVTLVTEPSNAARRMRVDACMASRLPAGSDVTSVKWHPYTNELVAISEDNACRLWALRPSHRIPSQFLPTPVSSAALQPRMTKVAMTPIAF